MSINLNKGDKIDLRKTSPELSRITVGLGWDPVSGSKGGVLRAILGSTKADIDCDASVFMLNKNGSFDSEKGLIYYARLKSKCGSIVHVGDNLTGDGDGDDEQIFIDLDRVPSNIESLLFVVNIYDCKRRKHHFGMIKNAYIRVFDKKTDTEIIKYNLSDNYTDKTALIVGSMYRKDGSWQFNAIGEGTTDTSISNVGKNLNKIKIY